MIKVAPGSPVWPLLCSIVKYPGQLDTEALVRIHYPWKTGPIVNYREYKAAQAKHSAEAHTKISRALSRLGEAGYLMKSTGVQLDPTFQPYWDRKGITSLQGHQIVVDDRGDIVGSQEIPVMNLAVQIVETVVANPGIDVKDLSYRTGGRSAAGNVQGAWTFQYEKLIREGVICPPRFRWPTPAGVALVASLTPAEAPAAPLLPPLPAEHQSPLESLG